jgi:hypothetical protein
MSQCNKSGTVTQISKLTEVAGNAKLHLCYCAHCGPSNVNVKWSSNLTFSWAVHLFCNICHSNWTICTICTSLRYRVSRHDILAHKKMNKTDDIDTQECVLSDQPIRDNVENDFFEMVDSNVEECKVSDQHNSTMTLMKDLELLNLLSSLSFGKPSSDFFFKHDIQNAIGGGGASAVVTRAITGTDVSPTVVHPKDVNFHVSICKFVRLLSRSEQVAFAEIISLSEDVVKYRYYRD